MIKRIFKTLAMLLLESALLHIILLPIDAPLWASLMLQLACAIMKHSWRHLKK